MLGWIVDRMVDRAMPRFIKEPEQERIAEEAAENGIRQTARIASIAGVILLAVIAAILFKYIPGQHINEAPLTVTEVERNVGTADAELRQAEQDSERRLEDVTKERDALQGKVSDLEGQVAELNRQLQAARDSAAVQDALQPPRQEAKHTRTREITRHPGTYRCGDGRTVQNPAGCKAANELALQGIASPPDVYRCGDGRSVRNPLECK
jgi:TolA-binding protein